MSPSPSPMKISRAVLTLTAAVRTAPPAIAINFGNLIRLHERFVD